MDYIIKLNYFGEFCALMAALCWSIAVIVFKSASNTISPILIVALKNSIALIFFIITFIVFDIPFWHDAFSNFDYLKIVLSGLLGMGLGDILFITALSRIGANRVAIVNCFEPAVIYIFSIFILGTVLTMQQLIGFSVVIISLFIISYENDYDDIALTDKSSGLFMQIMAIILSSIGIVIIKPVLSKVTYSIELQIWVTVFRLFPGFIFAWIVFLVQNNKSDLIKPLKNNSVMIGKLILSSGLGTFIALSFWIIGYANIEKPPVASIIGQTSVIFISILSWYILKEKISRLRIISMLVAILGVLLITIK